MTFPGYALDLSIQAAYSIKKTFLTSAPYFYNLLNFKLFTEQLNCSHDYLSPIGVE